MQPIWRALACKELYYKLIRKRSPYIGTIIVNVLIEELSAQLAIFSKNYKVLKSILEVQFFGTIRVLLARK